jgi:hypothetical protein
MATIDFKTVPTDVPLTVENVNRLAARAAELATAFKARIEKIQQQFADARERYSREADDVVREADTHDRDVARKFAKQQAASRIAKFRLNIEQSSRSQRQELLRPFAKLAHDAEFLLSLNQSPAQSLGRVALGDTKRTNYQAQLEGAGPVELETAAVTAIATNDLPLAAAVMTIVDRRPRDRRPFAVADFAGRVWGAQHAELTNALNGVIVAYKTALAADREFVRGKGDALTNLSLSLARRAIDEATAGDAA